MLKLNGHKRHSQIPLIIVGVVRWDVAVHKLQVLPISISSHEIVNFDLWHKYTPMIHTDEGLLWDIIWPIQKGGRYTQANSFYHLVLKFKSCKPLLVLPYSPSAAAEAFCHSLKLFHTLSLFQPILCAILSWQVRSYPESNALKNFSLNKNGLLPYLLQCTVGSLLEAVG